MKRRIETPLRALGAVLLAVIIATTLTACIGTADRDLANWLNGREGVESTTAQAQYPELIYHGDVHAELKPDASNATIETLIKDTLAYIADHKVASVDVEFGIDGLTFAVTDDSLGLLPVWQKVRKVPDVIGGFVSTELIYLSTLRTDVFDVLAATTGLGTDVSIATYATAADVPTPDELGNGTYVDPVTIASGAECTPDPVIISMVRSIVADDVLAGSLDLCDGIDVQFEQGYAIGAEAVDLRGQLDAAGLSDFPITLDALATGAASPSDDPGYDPADAPEHHRVMVSPGDPAVLGVLAALDAASGPVLYDLRLDTVASTADPTTDANTADAAEAAGDPPVRTLLVSSRSMSASGLAGLVASAPAAFASIRVDDGVVGAIGTVGELGDRVAAATALQAAHPEIEGLTVAGPNAELDIKNTGSSDKVPDVAGIAAALKQSGLWQGRDILILYDNQRADVIDGVSQVLDPSYFNNDDEVLQGVLDAWTAIA